MPDTINVFDVLCNGTDFFLLLAIGIVFAALFFTQRANGRFQQTFAYFLQVPSAAGLTALEVARRLLQHAGLNGVRVTPGTGLRGRSQYHPITREITLAQSICTCPSLAALGVAAHEVGHALQHARHYRFAWLRKVLVPVVQVCFLLAIATLVFGVMAGWSALLWTSLGCFASCTLFSMVTLPAEWDASVRARKLAIEAALVQENERAGLDQVLRTAWFTYLGKAVQSGCGVVGLALLLSRLDTQYAVFPMDGLSGSSLGVVTGLQIVALIFLFKHRRQRSAGRSATHAIELNNAGNLLAEQGDLAGAIDHYTRALKLDPRLAQAYCNRGAASGRAGRLDEGLADLNRAVYLAPTVGQNRLTRAQIHLARKEHDAALRDLEEALRLVPENLPTIRLYQGSVWLDMGAYDRAVEAFSEALQRGGHWPLARCNRALAYLRNGDLQEALVDCDEAIRLAPEDAIAYNNRGAVLMKLGDYARALTDLRTANRLNPRQPNVYKNLAWLQATCPDATLRDGAEAVANATRAIERAPEMRSEWLDILAAAHAEAGQFDDAVRHQEEVVAKCPASSRDEQQARLELYQAGQPFRAGPGEKQPPWSSAEQIQSECAAAPC